MPKLSESLHLGLFADDLPAMVAFYRDTLGFETDWDGGPFARFAVGDGGLFMFSRELFHTDLGLPYTPHAGLNTTMEIGLCVGSYAAVDETYARLAALGVPSLTGEPVTRPWGQRNFFITDPQGNILEIGS